MAGDHFLRILRQNNRKIIHKSVTEPLLKKEDYSNKKIYNRIAIPT